MLKYVQFERSKMQENTHTDVKITSTPLELSRGDSYGGNDSGYHSNLSAFNSSSHTTSLNQTRSRSLTPENVLYIESIRESDELYKRNREPSSFQNFCHQSLIGKEYVDFFFYLGEKGCYSPILRKILTFLPDEDLYNASGVSRTWKNIIVSIPAERRRLKLFTREVQITKENRVMNKTESDICEVKFESPRSTLMQIQNIRKEFSLSNSPVSSVSPPTAHNTNFRFEAYQKEGRKLKIGKRLFSCPKCKLPSQVDQTIPNTAECTNSGCSYRFCILCHCEEHKTKMCDFISTPVIRKQCGSVGTIKSKKNLKRLLL